MTDEMDPDRVDEVPREIPENHGAGDDAPLGNTYHKGPVILRGSMIPEQTTTGNLLATEDSADWLHMDPWRVMRIQAEFVDGFGALAELGPAVSIFGSARTKRHDPMYRGKDDRGEQRGSHHGRRSGHHGGGEPRRCGRRRHIGWFGHRTSA